MYECIHLCVCVYMVDNGLMTEERIAIINNISEAIDYIVNNEHHWPMVH